MFDKDLEKLVEISKELEREDTTLSEGVKLYEEGCELAKSLFKELDEVKGKITMLKQELDKYKEEGLDN